MIDTALGDQGITEAGPAALCQDPRSQLACPLPITRTDLDERQFTESQGYLRRKLRVTQHFGKHNRYH